MYKSGLYTGITLKRRFNVQVTRFRPLIGLIQKDLNRESPSVVLLVVQARLVQERRGEKEETESFRLLVVRK